MINKVSLTAAFLLTFGFAQAQDNNSPPAGSFQVGIEAGPSVALLRGVPFTYTMLGLYGGAGGITGMYNISGAFAVKAALMFEQRGDAFNIIATDNNGNNIGTINNRDQINYLTIPILARYTVPGTLRFYVNGGPYFGDMLSDVSYSTFNGAKSATDNTSFDKRFDAGICLGVGIDKQVSDKITLNLELRGSDGLMSIVPLPNPVNNGIYNEALALLIGARYSL